MTAHVAERRGALSEVVAANVRAECARRGWHQGVVAERMGMARNAVSDRARGRTPWTLDEVAQLAVLFGVEVSELLARPKGFEPLTFWLGADYSLTVFEVGRVRSLGSIRSLRYAGACDACGKASEPVLLTSSGARLWAGSHARHVHGVLMEPGLSGGTGSASGGVGTSRCGPAVLQTISRGKPAYGWECPCGAGGGPFAALQTAATLAEDHEQRHARARELTVERFLTAPVFS